MAGSAHAHKIAIAHSQFRMIFNFLDMMHHPCFLIPAILLAFLAKESITVQDILALGSPSF
jgi:hypothetical protein